MPVAHILSQGNELVTGLRTDTNATHLAARLTGLGFAVRGVWSCGDRLEDLVATLAGAAEGADLVVSTGGLGPTEDDLTAEAAARAAGVGLALDEGALQAVARAYAAYGREPGATGRKQATLPAGSEVVPNPVGSAPGFALAIGGAWCVFLPGVPREMEAMLEASVVPMARARWDLAPPRQVTFRVAAVGESDLQRRLAALPPRDGRIHLGFRTFLHENHVKLTAPGDDDPALARDFARAVEAARAILGDDCFTEADESLPAVVDRLLRERGHTVAVAESCTGGLLGSWITSVSGSSDVFRMGWLTYADEAKQALLGVPAAALGEHGAVSEPVARAMAEGARARAGADWALAITGVAGPTGGTAEKPVGTVFVAVAGPERTEVRRFQFFREREVNRRLSARSALELLRRALLRGAA